MKDPEFIELLNLYLDHEISAEDSARLEAEVQRDSGRRQIYQEYCRMQKACVLLAQAPEAATKADRRNVFAFEPQRPWFLNAYATGLCAAAACVALVFVARSKLDSSAMDGPSGSTTPLIAAIQPAAPETNGSRSIARTVSTALPSRTDELKPAFIAHSLALNGDARTEDLLPPGDARFDWIRTVQVSSLKYVQAQDLVFDAKANQFRPSQPFRGQNSNQAQVETTAFQFQR